MSKKFDLEAYKKHISQSDYSPVCNLDSFIYKIQNLVTGKVYIGRTVRNPEQRWKEHGYKRTTVYNRSLIGEAIQREGKDAFNYSIVAVVDKRVVDLVEANFIEHYDCLAPKGYNCVKLYEKPTISAQTKERMAASRVGKEPWNKGRKGAQVAWNKGIPNELHRIPIVSIKIATGEVQYWKSSSEAVKELNLNSGHVTQCCKGRLPHHKGYYFKYQKDYKPDQGDQ
jgi:hypothetical protein